MPAMPGSFEYENRLLVKVQEERDELRRQLQSQAAELGRLREQAKLLQSIADELAVVGKREKEDGTLRLCQALYGECRAVHYLGGSDAKMLYDGAAEITRLRAVADGLAKALEAALDGREKCRPDHNGFCQAHYSAVPCGIAEARAALARHREGGTP